MSSLHLLLVLILICPQILIQAQQPYIRKANTDCTIRNVSTSVLGYACNGVNKTCQTYLTFRSKPPYNTVTSISKLLKADPTQLSQLNSVSETANFKTGETVLVPTTCSCLGQFYQANASYITQAADTPFSIANNTFEGLSTCHAIQVERTDLTSNIYTGSKLTVPLRCACPTEKQAAAGVKYLLSYLVTWGQSVSAISAIFEVDTGLTLDANQLSEQDFTVYPFTTLLVPLSNQPSRSQTLAPPPPPTTSSPPKPPPPTTTSSDHKWVYMLIGVLGGVGVTFTVGFGFFWFCLSKRKRTINHRPAVSSASQSFEAIEKPLVKNLDVDDESEFMESLNSIAQSLKVYKFDELKLATQDFSPDCLIKGSVYKGKINEDFVAIKKMHGDVSKEIQLLNTIHHHNLIRLSGVCFNDGHWYLVYEFADNGPLSDWIYYSGLNSNKSLNWIQRIQVALDVANGLNYLHSYTTPPYVYKNLKSSNILLDAEFRAKITNFDLARSAEGQDGQFALTRHIVGTRGYMSPEYLENGLISTKLDVYGLGVLILEIVTGKHVSDLSEKVNKNLSDILEEVLFEEDNKKLTDIFDPRLQGNYPPEIVMAVVRLTYGCLDKDPSARPDMNEVSHSLSRILTTSQATDMSD
ncbi:lysM domain receptor-like kinase 4 [Rutidosis leptorrhynchoides]|uniref:lysM domain receptor-like kinase 4 n=1 Tax=Rutidosis leptorrhynchoides TaxID=125765 RepID=UPI003A996D59